MRLDGLVQVSEEKKSWPVDGLIFVHGTGGNFYASTLFDALGERSLQQGTAVLRVNTRGHDGISNAVTTAATVYANYTIVASLLGELGLMPDGYRTRPFWAMLGLSILTSLGTVIGFMLLIVPGVLLLVRWSLCVPVLIGEETGVFEAMARSWQETKGRFWPIFGVFVTIYAVALLAGAVFAMLAFLISAARWMALRMS